MSELLRDLAVGKIAVPTSRLGGLEDELVQTLMPPSPDLPPRTVEGALHSWNLRVPLLHAFKGKRFNGRVLDVSLELFPDTTKTLVDYLARETPPESLAAIKRIGFLMTANVSSSVKREAGTLQKPVFLERIPIAKVKSDGELWRRRVGKDTGDNTLAEIFRKSVETARSPHVAAGHSGGRKPRRSGLKDTF